MRRFSRCHGLVGVASVLVASACASGQSILQAGNRPAAGTVTTTSTTSAAPGGTVGAPTTIWLGGGTSPPSPAVVPTTIQLVPTPAPAGVPTTIQLVPPRTEGSRPGGFAGAPGVTVSLAGSTDFADCPVDALDDAAGPVRIEFWHTMQSEQADALAALTDEFNAGQDRIVVELNFQSDLIDKYFQSRHEARPHIAQMPEYILQQMADANTVIPTTACIQRSGMDISPFLERAMFTYQTGGVQWAMPFNISNPVLFYNRAMFEEAGLDPDRPPVTLDALRDYSQQIVDSGAATYGIALDSRPDGGGGWFLEQWLARAGLLYADNDNGRTARATQVLWNTPEAVEMLTFAQELVDDGLAVYVGEAPQGFEVLFRMTDPQNPAAMAMFSSGGLGGVLAAVEGGLASELGITADDVGVGPMPGPSDTPSALVGGASLYITRDKGDAEAAAAWEYVQYLVDAEVQSQFAAASGYAPVRADATDIDPLSTIYATDPRFEVTYDQVTTAVDDFSALGPVLGPMLEIRRVTADMMTDIFNGADVETALAAAEQRANLIIIDYNSRN